MRSLQPYYFSTPSSLNEVRILQWNANEARPRFLELKEFLRCNSFDIVLIQETKLPPSHSIQEPGFKCYRRDRLSAHHLARTGGGVLTLLLSSNQEILNDHLTPTL